MPVRRYVILSVLLSLFAGGMAGVVSLTAQASACTASLGSSCGAYDYNPPNAMSNGFNTYVEDQGVGAQAGTTQTINVTSPGTWSATANDVPYGYTGVQTFPADQQLMGDWCASGGWQPQAGCSTQVGYTPVTGVSALTVNYSETARQHSTDPNVIDEYAADTWPHNYSDDIMFWTDTQGRCDTGAYGDTILAPAVSIDGQTWTLNRYGAAGGELIWVLDANPAVPDSCAQQTSGTIDIDAAYQWMIGHGIITATNQGWDEVDAGWEITSADNATFTVTSYSISATVAGSTPSPSPSPTPTSPSPSPTSTSPSPTPTSSSPSPSPTPAATAEKVTASVSNGWPGFALKTLVLDGAAEAGGAGAHGQTTSGVAKATITPASSHSLPVFGLASGSTATAYTARAGNTFWDNTGDASQGWAYADGRYTGTVTAGTAITVGSSAPTGQYQAWGAYELRPAGSSVPTVDAATPAEVHNEATSASTASFTPPPGSVVAVIAEANGFGSGPTLGFTLTDTAGLHWTLREVTGANNEGVAIWTATVPSGSPSPSPSPSPTSTAPSPSPTSTAPSPSPTSPSPSPTSTTPSPSPTSPSPSSTAFSCVTSADNGYCPAPGQDYNDPAITLNTGSNIYIANNVFNHNLLPSATQTLSANNPGDWKVVATMASGNTAVISGPQVRVDVPGAPAALSGFHAVYAGFTENQNAHAGTGAEFGYDVWSSTSSSNMFSQEMMIWTDTINRGTCGGATTVASGVPFGGTNGVPVKNWDLCRNGPAGNTSEYIWWLPNQPQMTSGSVDILSMINWMTAHGYYPSATGFDQIDQTFEICSTGGTAETFQVTGDTLTSN